MILHHFTFIYPCRLQNSIYVDLILNKAYYWLAESATKICKKYVSDRNKKYLIAVLLLAACSTSMVLLVYLSAAPVKKLENLAEADSLIQRDLRTFNISSQQISAQNISINEQNTRKLYEVNLPPDFSKTQLHQEIHSTFYEYGISSPARVTFPEKNYHIYLMANNTIFATIQLKTDSDLNLIRSFGSILVAFEELPSDAMRKRLEAFSEPLPIVLKMEDISETTEIFNRIWQKYEDIMLWLQDDYGNIINENSQAMVSKLQQIQKHIPQAGVLSFQSLNQNDNPDFLQTLSGTKLDFIDVSEAILLHSDMGRAAFDQELQKFRARARRGEYPVAIVMAEEESLEWLQEELVNLKKSGLRIISPKKNNFHND
jgi:hypothetical protein